MRIIHTVKELRAALQEERNAGNRIGFVPTMGALHNGHGSLVKASVANCDITVVSVFVNPTQFGPNEDFDKYPRTLQEDAKLVGDLGAAIVFAPSVDEVYPEGTSEVLFSLKTLDQSLCGATRPGHFNGVLQVVAKLFNMVRPDAAFFGEKDFQQLTILRRLALELHFDIEIVGCDIIREADGLAMSSRNRYLAADERKQAVFLSKALKMVQQIAANAPETPVSEIEGRVRALANEYDAIRIDYFDVRSGLDLSAVSGLSRAEAPRAIMAAFCGTTRLIDNMPVFPNE